MRNTGVRVAERQPPQHGQLLLRQIELEQPLHEADDVAARGLADVERTVGDDDASGGGMVAGQLPLRGAHLAVQAAQRRVRIVLGNAARRR